MRSFSVIVAFLLLTLQPTHGYASWFVERSSSCWVMLRDPSEVVMNNFIVPHDKSSTPGVRIDLFDKESNSPIDVKIVDGKRIVYIEEDAHAATTNEKKWSREYVVKLNHEEHKDQLKDLQYVMDIKVFPELDDDELGKLDGSETRVQAEFTSGTRGCRNYRVSGRANDDGVDLKIVVPSSLFQLNEASLSDHSADITAGYACGHEAVMLTQSIIFQPRVKLATTSTATTSDGGSKIDKKELAKEEEIPGSLTLGEDTPNDVEKMSGSLALGEDTPNDVEKSQTDEKLNQNQAPIHASHHGQEGRNIDDADLIEEGEVVIEEDKKGPSKEEGGVKREDNNDLRKKKTNMRHRKQEEKSQVRQFKDKYEKEDFGQAKFTANSYITAIVVFLIVGGTVVNALLAMGNSRGRNKREHTL